MSRLRACRECLRVCWEDRMHDRKCGPCAGAKVEHVEQESPWWRPFAVSLVVSVLVAMVVMWLLFSTGVLR